MSTPKKTGSDETARVTITFVPPPAVADMIYAALAAEPHIDPATTLSELGQLKAIAGNYDEAAALYLTSLAIAKKAVGPDHPLVKLTTRRLAGLLRITGRAEEADALTGSGSDVQDTAPTGRRDKSSAN